MKVALAALIALMLLQVPPSRAEPAEDTVCLIFQPAVSQEEDRIRTILISQLDIELENRGFSVLYGAGQEAITNQGPLAEEELLRLAAQTGASTVLTGSIRVQELEIILEIQGYRARTNTRVIEVERRAPTDISLYNQVSSLVQEIVPALRGQAAAVMSEPSAERAERPKDTVKAEAAVREGPSPADTPTGMVRLTLLSPDEGAQIRIAPEQEPRPIENGRLVVEAPAGAALTIERTKPGYHADRETISIPPHSAAVGLRPLVRASRFGIELVYTSSQFLGFGAAFRYYLIPDTLLLRVQHYANFSPAAPAAFHNDVNLRVGSYLFAPPRNRLRVGIGTGLGLIFSVRSPSAFLDVYWEIFDLWLEANFRRWAFFAKSEGRFSLDSALGMLPRGFLTRYGPQYTTGLLLKL